MTDPLFSIPCKTIEGENETLADFRAKALLVVNTASKCSFTPQYEGLEQLWKDYAARGLVVLGFPCNQFLGQEPGGESEISRFCQLNYGVGFPMFAKVDVNGAHTHPLFVELKKRAPGLLGVEAIKWNFTKFLVDTRDGSVRRFAPATSPESLRGPIEELLGEG